jgi:hypothetical protein
MSEKFDGVVDAVRYKGGQIQYVRAYERRGATFSDHLLLPRADLLKRLKEGRKFVTGQRKEFLASTFETGKSIQLFTKDAHEIVATRADAAQDDLEGLPVF